MLSSQTSMISQFKPKDGDVAIIRLQGSSTASPSIRKENNFLDHLKELKKEDLDIQKELKQRGGSAAARQGIGGGLSGGAFATSAYQPPPASKARSAAASRINTGLDASKAGAAEPFTGYQ